MNPLERPHSTLRDPLEGDQRGPKSTDGRIMDRPLREITTNTTETVRRPFMQREPVSHDKGPGHTIARTAVYDSMEYLDEDELVFVASGEGWLAEFSGATVPGAREVPFGSADRCERLREVA